MTGKKITAQMLREKGASCSAVDVFEKEWPAGAFVSLKNIRKAQEINLDIDWFAFHFFTATAREAYNKATATAGEAYKKATATARGAYKKATATAWEAYDKATATAWEAYNKATAPALYNTWRLQCQSTKR